MGGMSLTKINLEIIDYINSADFDDNLKNFFISAIIFEMRNPNSHRFSAAYESMIESALKED